MSFGYIYAVEQRQYDHPLDGTQLVALVDLITLAFPKVSYVSFPNVHIALRIYLSTAISSCNGK